MQYGNDRHKIEVMTDARQFKSYYVVWKLEMAFFLFASISRLNRTMQYGNSFRFLHIFRSPLRLNRTMQYGNQYHHWRVNLFWNSLNRTMQYGNVSLPVFSAWLPPFKSYYVVWKLFCGGGIPSVKAGLNRTMQYGNFPEK